MNWPPRRAPVAGNLSTPLNKAEINLAFKNIVVVLNDVDSGSVACLRLFLSS